jgi:hypothetical protein
MAGRRNTVLRELQVTTRQLRVTTKENTLADDLSRGAIDAFWLHAAEAGISPVLMDLDESIRNIDWLLKP